MVLARSSFSGSHGLPDVRVGTLITPLGRAPTTGPRPCGSCRSTPGAEGANLPGISQATGPSGSGTLEPRPSGDRWGEPIDGADTRTAGILPSLPGAPGEEQPVSDTTSKQSTQTSSDTSADARRDIPSIEVDLDIPFVRRHIGPRDEDIAAMLDVVGKGSLDELIATTLPDEIRTPDRLIVDAAPSEQAVLAELREKLRTQLGDWYVIHTYSGMENRVKQNVDSRAQTLNMEDYIFETVVPTEEVVEIRNNARKTVTRCVLPGYVLIRMELTDDSWSLVRQTPSVTGIVGHGQQPVSLSIDEVVHMLTPSVIAQVNAAQAGAAVTRKKKIEVVDFAVGDSVMVTDGPFTGVHATITEINANNQRLRALVEILGRETPVDLEFKQVEKVV